jgi:REP element-mobilizing transposase RayT
MEFTTSSTEVICAYKFLKMIMNIFLTLLKTGLEKENIGMHAYYLMPNHFHLLICYEASITLVSLYNG